MKILNEGFKIKPFIYNGICGDCGCTIECSEKEIKEYPDIQYTGAAEPSYYVHCPRCTNKLLWVVRKS